MSVAAQIREMYNNGLITDCPEDKKLVAAKFGIAVQTVHATLKKHLAKRNGTSVKVPTTSRRPQVVQVNYSDVTNAILNRFRDCLNIAENKGYGVPEIPVKFDLRGTTAGMFCSRQHGLNKYFRVNLTIAKDNLDDYLDRTVPHEVAHYIVNEHYKHYSYRRVQPHGYEWQNVMISIFGLEPSRCHSYNVDSINPFVYKCACKTHNLSKIRHGRVMRGSTYHCSKCRTKLVFVKKIDK